MKKDDRLPRIWSAGGEDVRFEIWDYVWSAATAAIADKQLLEIDRVCFVLGAWPEYGRARDDAREMVRQRRKREEQCAPDQVPHGRFLLCRTAAPEMGSGLSARGRGG